MAFEKIKNWFGSKKRDANAATPVALPPDGRSSVETTLLGQIASSLNQFGGYWRAFPDEGRLLQFSFYTPHDWEPFSS